MTQFTRAIALACPVSDLINGNGVNIGDATGQAFGWGAGNFSIPLGTGETATHYGLCTVATPQRVAILTGTASLPAFDWSQFGVTGGEVEAFIGALSFEVLVTDGTDAPAKQRAAWAALLTELGVSRVDA